MKRRNSIGSLILLGILLVNTKIIWAGAHLSRVVERKVEYTDGTTTCSGFISLDTALKGKRPAILVVHEWWGCNDYSRKRARMLAELGYVAFAVDLYGEGKLAENPEQAMQYATPFYQDPALMMKRLEAALNALKRNDKVDTSKIAAIGYCFGGSMLLNAAKLGINLKGVVSFHGGLNGIPATPGSTKARILVCHGGADSFVSAEEIKSFKSNLDSVGVTYQFVVYPGATHAFTNPDATKLGIKFEMPIRYNLSGDHKSWSAVQRFLENLFK